MSKIVSVSTLILKPNMQTPVIMTTIAFEDGRVLNTDGSFGNDEKVRWKELRPADEYDKGEYVGNCRDCGLRIYSEDEWQYEKDNPNVVWHALEESCKS